LSPNADIVGRLSQTPRCGAGRNGKNLTNANDRENKITHHPGGWGQTALQSWGQTALQINTSEKIHLRRFAGLFGWFL
jgi:hypothetical protein